MGAERYLFGPVPSRRLGRSLGVDLIPPKTCTFNCVYCQLGPTPACTVERRNYVPMADVLEELRAWQAGGGTADVVTLAGSGEPTLHLEFGRVPEFVRDSMHMRSVLLTNGTLLYQEDVRRQACQADVVKVTLSAWDEASFCSLHRPHASITFQQTLEGERLFRSMFRGEFWVEVFLVAGVNTSDEALQKISGLVQTLRPDRIHLNTAVRPAAEGAVTAVGADVLSHACALMGERAEITASVSSAPSGEGGVLSGEAVLRLIGRHPCSADDLAAAFGAGADAVAACLEELLRQGKVLRQEREGVVYYAWP